MSIELTPREATLRLYTHFFNADLEQVEKDIKWILDNVSDQDKREKRLKYQNWRKNQLITMIALLGTLD